MSKSHPTKVCTVCEIERRINWHHRNRPGPYVCKYCTPRKTGPRYVNFDMATYQRDWNLQRRYGITAAEYDQRLATQAGVCAICRKPPSNRRLYVDHSHASGFVRGLLCVTCNSRLEWFEEFHEVVTAYLGTPEIKPNTY